jgi:two-component system chemotaxis response regulator CheB
MEKPTGLEEPGAWERQFLSAVRVVARVKVITHPRARLSGWSQLSHAKTQAPSIGSVEPTLVVVGVSTGGPSALVELLRSLPSNFSPPVLIVLHLAAAFATAFAEWLSAQSGRDVRYARDGEPLRLLSRQVRLAPADRHLVVQNGRLQLSSAPERHSCRPSVDVLFESVAADIGAPAVGVLMTGMGKDGALGLLALRQLGATTIAQDEATSVIYGMPREAVQLGAAVHVLPLDEIGPRLRALFAQGMKKS